VVEEETLSEFIENDIEYERMLAKVWQLEGNRMAKELDEKILEILKQGVSK
jgi:hypothetical protein